MTIKELVLDTFYTMWKEIIDTITLPTGKQLAPALCFSAGITGISIIGAIRDWPLQLVDWRGGLFATIALAILFFVERRGYLEVSRLYRIAKSRAKDFAKRPAGSSTDVEDAGGCNPGDPEP